MHVQFLAFSGCPLAEPARENLKKALAGSETEFEEIDLLDSDCPTDLPGWGSPTILVNGEDVTGQPRGNSVSCRVYNTPGGVPSVESIKDCLEKNKWTTLSF